MVIVRYETPQLVERRLVRIRAPPLLTTTVQTRRSTSIPKAMRWERVPSVSARLPTHAHGIAFVVVFDARVRVLAMSRQMRFLYFSNQLDARAHNRQPSFMTTALI